MRLLALQGPVGFPHLGTMWEDQPLLWEAMRQSNGVAV
jgi:hypothetical protein